MADDLNGELRGNIPLSEMIESLRRELQVATTVGRDHAVQFTVGEAEIELELAVEKTREGGGEVKFWVVAGKGGAKRSDTDTFRFRLKLQPISRAGGPLKISDFEAAGPR